MPRLIRSIVREGYAPAVAVMFWVLIGVLVFLTLASAAAKGTWMETIVSGVGSIGQVVFAAMVYRLGVRQFEFTQTVTDRQHRIDTYPIGSAIYDRLRALYLRNTNVWQMEEGQTEEYMSIYVAAERVFSQKLSEEVYSLFELADDSYMAQQKYERLKGSLKSQTDFEDLEAQQEIVNKLVEALGDYGSEVLEKMTDELSLR